MYGGVGRLRLYGELGFVYQDEFASLLDDDDAEEIGGGITFPGEQLDWGIHFLHRDQVDKGSTRLEYWVYDAHMRWVTPLFLSHSELLFETEALLVKGSTDRAIDESGNSMEFVGWSLAGRFELRWLCPRVTMGAEAGLVSGDDPGTARSERLTLDPDYRVGLILFSDVLKNVTVRSAERLLAVERSDGRRRNSRDEPTDGGLRNVMFLAPGLTWRPSNFTVTGQVVMAWSSELMVDRAQSEMSGRAVNSIGQSSTSRFLGLEINGVFRYSLPWRRVGRLGIGADLGTFWPGPALSRTVGHEPIPKIVWRLDLGW